MAAATDETTAGSAAKRTAGRPEEAKEARRSVVQIVRGAGGPLFMRTPSQNREDAMQVHFVIHHRDNAHSIKQAKLAFEAGADGVFLISHDDRDTEIARLAPALMMIGDASRRLKVGVNLLSKSAVTAYTIAATQGLNMVWMDSVGIHGIRGTNQTEALAMMVRSMPVGQEIEVFASVAFKYQAKDPHPIGAARLAVESGFIPTTSGEATGRAPDIEKIKGMGMACDRRLAVASGLTAENLPSFAPYISHALVATGISADEHTIDFNLARQFIVAARASSAAGIGQAAGQR